MLSYKVVGYGNISFFNLEMSEWLIVAAVFIVAVLFLVYQANQPPSFNPAPPK
jgi:disulfide bond formation protein DsbB